MTTNQDKASKTTNVEGDTPTLRLFALLEVIAEKDDNEVEDTTGYEFVGDHICETCAFLAKISS